jgi:excisionase family DNA binding protein
MEIKENEIYTSDETQNLLKISESTFIRLIRKGILRAAKVGGQYRILGREILQLVSPELSQKAANLYQKVKTKIKSLEKE